MHTLSRTQARRIAVRAQLLDNPFGGRVPGDIEVQDLPALMFNHEETIERAKSERGQREKVYGDDSFTVVVKEGKPTFSGITSPSNEPQISSDMSCWSCGRPLR